MSNRQVPELSLLSYLEGGGGEKARFVDKLFAGIKDYGFIILTDHTICPNKVSEAYELAHEFFYLPEEVKKSYSAKNNGGQRGYTSFGQEHAKDYAYPDLKEFWHVGREIGPHHPYARYYPSNIWPKELAGFRQMMMGLYQEMDKISQVLLQALETALEVPEGYFEEMIKDGNSILRLIHYPPIPRDAHPQSVRAAAHGDINLITLLLGATDGGLQLLDHSGQWLDVHSRPGQIVVDSGDMLSRITNNVIPSTIHRVINPDNSHSERYSMPYFVHPHPLAQLSCIPSCEGEGAKYPSITSHDFLMERLEQIGLKEKREEAIKK